jgi:hypothetical protein
VEENRSILGSVGDDRPISAAAALSRPSDTLFDEVASKICIDQAALGTSYSLAQSTVRDDLAAREPCELPCLEDPHGRRSRNV